MKTITFENIYTLGYVESENNLFKHVHDPEMTLRYDSNFIEFKTMPSLLDFKSAAEYLRNFHVEKGQKHVKFYFPENQKPTEELMNYMKEAGYMTGFLELYAIQPSQFPHVEGNPDIEIKRVNEENLETFLALQYQQDSEYGHDFANQKIALHKRNFQDPGIQQLLALYKGIPAGSVDIIISKETAEIDGLVVEETYQRKGIGSMLQNYTMEKFHDKTIILVADGEDTPKEMYKRQNYQFLGFKYHSYKVYDN